MLSISANSRSVAVGGGIPDKNIDVGGFVGLYDYTGESTLRKTQKTKRPVTALGCSPDEKSIAVGCDDGMVGIWSSDGAIAWLPQEHNKQVSAVCFHPKGNWLLTCARDNTVVIWDLLSRKKSYTLPLPDMGLSAAFTRGGEQFLIGYVGGCRVFKWPPGEKPSQDGADLPHQAGILFVAVDSEGETVLTGGNGPRVMRWHLKNRKQIGPGWPIAGYALAGSFNSADKEIFIAETDRTSRYSFYNLTPDATGTEYDLTKWIQHATGVKVEKGVSEVIPPLLLAASPKVEQEVDTWIKNWRASEIPRAAPVFPKPSVNVVTKPAVVATPKPVAPPMPEVPAKPVAPPTPEVPAKQEAPTKPNSPMKPVESKGPKNPFNPWDPVNR